MLNWVFIDNWWSAVSKLHDSGDSLDWRPEWIIKVTKDGMFSVGHSAPERAEIENKNFETLKAAMDWCQETENELSRAAKISAAFAEHSATTGINANAAYTGADTEQCKVETVKVADNYVTSTGSLKWYIADVGSFVACSIINNDKKPGLWQITTCKNGKFKIALGNAPAAFWTFVPGSPFESLSDAMMYCQERENKLAEQYQEMQATLALVAQKHLLAEEDANFSKNGECTVEVKLIGRIVGTGNQEFEDRTAVVENYDSISGKYRVQLLDTCPAEYTCIDTDYFKPLR